MHKICGPDYSIKALGIKRDHSSWLVCLNRPTMISIPLSSLLFIFCPLLSSLQNQSYWLTNFRVWQFLFSKCPLYLTKFNPHLRESKNVHYSYLFLRIWNNTSSICFSTYIDFIICSLIWAFKGIILFQLRALMIITLHWKNFQISKRNGFSMSYSLIWLSWDVKMMF